VGRISIAVELKVNSGYESGFISINSAYECLAKHARGPQHDLFKCLWKVKVLSNVITIAWRVLLDRIPTRMCLSRRGMVVNITICAMCQAMDESSQHLFLE